MQRIFASPWTPEEYVTTEAYRQIIPESMCPSCLRAVRLTAMPVLNGGWSR